MPLFTTDGHLTDEGLSVYVEALREDALDRLEPAVPAHIQSCLDCHRQAVDLYALVSEIGRAEAAGRPHTTVTRLRRVRWTPWAAAAAVIGLVLFATRPWERPGEGSALADERTEQQVDSTGLQRDGPFPPADQPKDIAQKPKDKPSAEQPENPGEADQSSVTALAFEPNEHLENVLGEMTRSENVRIKTPAAGNTFKPGEEIKFEWEGAESGLEIVILNNRDEVLSRDKAAGRKLNRKAPSTPGLYYWKLETDDDLLYVGKFLVR